MKDDFTTNSHYLIYTFLLRKVGRMYFLNLGVKESSCDHVSNFAAILGKNRRNKQCIKLRREQYCAHEKNRKTTTNQTQRSKETKTKNGVI